MTSVAPALNGVYMHMPTETPRVHDLTFDHSHTRPKACKAHPLAEGRLYIGKQNTVRTILGRLVSSLMRKNINMSILEDAIRQAYSLDSL